MLTHGRTDRPGQTLSAFYHDSTDINNAQHRKVAAIRLIAKMPTWWPWHTKYGVGQPFMYPATT